MDNNFNRYLEELVEQGYIRENGEPIKCVTCDSKEFDEVNVYRGSYGIEEYSLKCEKCGKIIGTWAYGHWNP